MFCNFNINNFNFNVELRGKTIISLDFFNIAIPDPWSSFSVLLVLLVNDSEYSRSTAAKPSLSLSCIYLVSPGARCCCSGSCGFLLLLLRAPTLPRPPFWGEGSTKNKIAFSVGVGGWACWRVRGRDGVRGVLNEI
jgi:hypothetical protein